MTPKTLDKYIAALKKKAAAGGWSVDQYQAELDKIKNEMAQQYLDNKMTGEEYTKVSKQLKNAEKNPGLLGKPAAQTAMTADQLYQLEGELVQQLSAKKITSEEYLDKMDQLQELYNKKAGLSEGKAVVAGSVAQGMSHEEYIGLWEALNKKKKAGLITPDEYSALGAKLDQAKKDKKTVQDIAKDIGCDPGTLATDESVLKLGKEMKKVYGQAAKEIQAELDAYLKKFGPEIHDLEAKFIDGTITEDELIEAIDSLAENEESTPERQELLHSALKFDDAIVFNIKGEGYRGKRLETLALQTSRVKAPEPDQNPAT